MKKLRLLGLVGITSFALAHAGSAAGHGGGGGGHGGGGGFHSGGGGFHGGGGGFHGGGGGFRGGGSGTIRTDITVPTVTRTVTIGTAGTVTKATPVMDTAMAADQGIFGVCGSGDKRASDGV